MKIGILRCNNEVVYSGVFPDIFVAGGSFDRKVASRRGRGELAFAVGRKRKGRQDIIAFEVREIARNFVSRHSRGKVLQDIIDCDAQAADTRLAAPFVRVDRDSGSIIWHSVFKMVGGIRIELMTSSVSSRLEFLGSPCIIALWPVRTPLPYPLDEEIPLRKNAPGSVGHTGNVRSSGGFGKREGL